MLYIYIYFEKHMCGFECNMHWIRRIARRAGWKPISSLFWGSNPETFGGTGVAHVGLSSWAAFGWMPCPWQEIDTTINDDSDFIASWPLAFQSEALRSFPLLKKKKKHTVWFSSKKKQASRTTRTTQCMEVTAFTLACGSSQNGRTHDHLSVEDINHLALTVNLAGCLGHFCSNKMPAQATRVSMEATGELTGSPSSIPPTPNALFY